MTKLPPLFIIDDERARLQNASLVLEELEVVPDALHLLHVNQAAQYLTTKELLRTATGKGIVLLDLGLRHEGELLWPPVTESLNELSARTGIRFSDATVNEAGDRLPEMLSIQTAEGVGTLKGNSLDGLSLIESLIQNEQLDPCLVVICTGLGDIGDLRAFINTFNETAKTAGRRLIFMKELDQRDLSTLARARGIIRDLANCWSASFPDFSEEPRIDAVIREWLVYFRSLAQTAREQFCWHDHIADNTDHYADILARSLDYTHNKEAFKNSNGLKALFMVQSHPLSSLGWPCTAFTRSKSSADNFQDSAKPIPHTMLKPLLKAISGLELEMSEPSAKLPTAPGLPFILSLCALFETLRREDILDKTVALRILVNGSGTRLTIPLKRDPEQEFGLARTWMRKVEKGGGTLNNGVCGRLWNVIRARVKLSLSALLNDSERKLLQLFEGQDRPVVGVHFAPHFIHLYWN